MVANFPIDADCLIQVLRGKYSLLILVVHFYYIVLFQSDLFYELSILVTSCIRIEHIVTHYHIGSVVEILMVGQIAKLIPFHYLTDKYSHSNASSYPRQLKSDTLRGISRDGIVG